MPSKKPSPLVDVLWTSAPNVDHDSVALAQPRGRGDRHHVDLAVLAQEDLDLVAVDALDVAVCGHPMRSTVMWTIWATRSPPEVW